MLFLLAFMLCVSSIISLPARTLSDYVRENGGYLQLEALDTGMYKLDLSKNALTSIHGIDLITVQYSDICERINLANVKNLVLDLSDNGLQSLSKDILNLTHLAHLDVSQNLLLTLPKHLEKLSNLHILDAHDNNLETLPHSIYKCKNLTGLYLNNNELKTISNRIDKLKKLRILHLQDNHLQGELPSSLARMKCLKELNISNNGHLKPISGECFYEGTAVRLNLQVRTSLNPSHTADLVIDYKQHHPDGTFVWDAEESSESL